MCASQSVRDAHHRSLGLQLYRYAQKLFAEAISGLSQVSEDEQGRTRKSHAQVTNSQSTTLAMHQEMQCWAEMASITERCAHLERNRIACFC